MLVSKRKKSMDMELDMRKVVISKPWFRLLYTTRNYVISS